MLAKIEMNSFYKILNALAFEIGPARLLLPDQSLCAQCFKRPKLIMSEFGVRKDLLIT